MAALKAFVREPHQVVVLPEWYVLLLATPRAVGLHQVFIMMTALQVIDDIAQLLIGVVIDTVFSIRIGSDDRFAMCASGGLATFLAAMRLSAAATPRARASAAGWSAGYEAGV
jgi:hypothetical protein